MTDQPNDIDIEAERKDFEPFARNELGLSMSRDDAPYGDDYWDEDAADAWCTWKKRARIAAEREQEMQAEIYRLRERHAEIVSSLYGQGFEVLGWHLNGDTEPLDNWFENNDWLDTPDNTQEAEA